MFRQEAKSKEISQLANLLQAATDNAQPVTLSLTLAAFEGIVGYRVEEALNEYRAQEERSRKENEQGDLIAPKEAKAMLRVSDATLWRYCRQGLLGKKNIGGKVFYSRAELKKLMEV